MKEQRIQSSNFKGQTILHVAIAKGNLEAVKIILENTKNEEIQKLLCTCAVGSKFNNTVLMGQLPLSVAALACKEKDFQIITHLLLQKAKIWNQNEDGDTVFHSLIKYADIYPEKTQHLKKTFEFLWEKFNEYCNDTTTSSNPTDILFWKNKSGSTLLCLSAKLGVNELFEFVINIQDVYRMTNIRDGLFDIREYDVTEFDRLISYTENEESNKKDKENKKIITVLESLFDSRCSHKEAFQILNQELVRFILQRKWMAYRKPLFIWMILHLTFISLFTASSIKKSEILFCPTYSETSRNIGDFFYAMVVITTTVGITYLIFAFLCIITLTKRCKLKSRKSVNFGLMLHNLDYIVCLLVTAISALLESCLIILKLHWDYHIVFALVSGWYFMLYFSPFSKRLVSFTHMIKSGFLEDFLPFVVVFVGLLFSFTAMMYMLFRGTHDVDEFDTFQSALLTMFNLGVGLNDIGVLSLSRIPWLAYTLFVVFVILSFIHLFNALVAIMSQTFSDVHGDRNSFLKYNKLKMIELFEDIILVKPLAKYLPFVLKAKHWTREKEVKLLTPTTDNAKEQKMKRYCSELHLLDKMDEYNDDKEEKKRLSKSRMGDLTKYLYNYQHVSKKKTTDLQRSSKINPEREVIFIVQKSSKSSQYPEVNSYLQ